MEPLDVRLAPGADIPANGGFAPILLQKSKIERRRTSRESRFLDALPLQRSASPMRTTVVVFARNNEVPHIAIYETHQQS